MKSLWVLKFNSAKKISEKDRDYITDLVITEMKHTKTILHDIAETNNSMSLLIEGSKKNLDNIVKIMKENITMKGGIKMAKKKISPKKKKG